VVEQADACSAQLEEGSAAAEPTAPTAGAEAHEFYQKPMGDGSGMMRFFDSSSFDVVPLVGSKEDVSHKQG